MLITEQEQSLIKIDGQELINRCQTHMAEYRNTKNYNVFSQPHTKGLQRATRLEWLLQKLSDEKASPERVFLELFKFYEKEETDSRLREFIFTQLCEAIGIVTDSMLSKTTNYDEILKQLGKTWLDINTRNTEQVHQILLIFVANKCRVDLGLKHPRFKYTTSELLAQCREVLVGHEDEKTYSFWNKPGKKGLTRDINLDILLKYLQNQNSLTEEEVFLEIYQFYHEDKDADSRLRADIGKILLRMLHINPNAKAEECWNEISKMFKQFQLGNPSYDLMQDMTNHILDRVSQKFISEKKERNAIQLGVTTTNKN